VHWKKLLPAALRKAYANVSEHPSGVQFSLPLLVISLVSPLHHQQLDEAISDIIAGFLDPLDSTYLCNFRVLYRISPSFPRLYYTMIYVKMVLLSNSLRDKIKISKFRNLDRLFLTDQLAWLAKFNNDDFWQN